MSGSNMLPPRLQNIGLKVATSINHLQTLDRDIARFLNDYPYEISRQFDPKERSYSYRAKALKNIPPQIRVLTGEVLYHLRTALDHLAWQVTLLTTDPPPDSTEFPIFWDPADYARKRDRYIRGMHTDHQKLIDECQPCAGPNPKDAPLWVLHRLTNDDKHRLPVVVSSAPHGVVLWGDGRHVAVEMRVGPFDDETVIGKAFLLNPSETNMEVKVDITFDLAFASNSAAKGRPVRPELMKIGQRVEEVVRKFQHLF